MTVFIVRPICHRLANISAKRSAHRIIVTRFVAVSHPPIEPFLRFHCIECRDFFRIFHLFLPCFFLKCLINTALVLIRSRGRGLVIVIMQLPSFSSCLCHRSRLCASSSGALYPVPNPIISHACHDSFSNASSVLWSFYPFVSADAYAKVAL